MKTEIVEVKTEPNGFYNVISYHPPRKRTILWNNDPKFIDFNFTTVIITPVFQYNNIIIKSGHDIIGGVPNNSDKIYPFNYPHVGPTNMKFCVYHKPNMLFFNDFENVAKTMAQIFWCSKNTSYMKDNFQLSEKDFSQPTISRNNEAFLSSIKKINFTNNDFCSNLTSFINKNDELDKTVAALILFDRKQINLSPNNIGHLLRFKNKQIIDLILNFTKSEKKSTLNLMFNCLLLSNNSKSLNYLINNCNCKNEFGEFVNTLILSFHNNQVMTLLEKIKSLCPQYLNVELIKQQLVNDPQNSFLRSLINK